MTQTNGTLGGCKILGLILSVALFAPVAMAQAPTTRPANAGAGGAFGDMIAQLRATPGCLGVVATQRMTNGQSAIFAFFENKQAATKWYFSAFHQRLVKMVDPELSPDHKPMAEIPDGVPIMAVASITMGGKPAVEGSPIPFSQIAIELFTPLSGGLNINGGFSPDAFREKVETPTTTPSPK